MTQDSSNANAAATAGCPTPGNGNHTVRATERMARVGRDMQLCYRVDGSAAHPPLVLIAGLGQQLHEWPDELVQGLVDAGFRVVRFDNRDTGRSSRAAIAPPTTAQFLARRFRAEQYTLGDMALDTLGLLDRLDIDEAHVVGMSMGGMIAQTLAARYPSRVRTLTSIMSTTGARGVGRPRLSTYARLFRAPAATRAGFADECVAMMRHIGSHGFPFDVGRVRAVAEEAWDRDGGRNADGAARQLAAIFKSGDRTAELRRITAPTLVLHGDRDVMVHPSGGRATQRAIPGARLLTIPGMGHDLPAGTWPQLISAISDHAHQVPQQLAGASRRAAGGRRGRAPHEPLAGQTVVITGAASGIGRALAQRLSEHGAPVAIVDADRDGLEDTARSLRGPVLAEVLDVRDRQGQLAFAAKVTSWAPRPIGAVFNNAGVAVTAAVADGAIEDDRWLHAINFEGVVHGVRAFLPILLAQGTGAIVNTSSVYGLAAVPYHSAYCASKFAVRGFTEALRHELVGTGVRAITVFPGGIKTNIARSARVWRDPGGLGRSPEQLIAEFDAMALTTPERAAEIIHRGVDAGKARILVGADAYIFDAIARVMPTGYATVLDRLERLVARTASGRDRGVHHPASPGPRDAHLASRGARGGTQPSDAR